MSYRGRLKSVKPQLSCAYGLPPVALGKSQQFLTEINFASVSIRAAIGDASPGFPSQCELVDSTCQLLNGIMTCLFLASCYCTWVTATTDDNNDWALIPR